MPDQQETDVNFKKEGIINSAMEKSPEMAQKVEKPEKLPGKPVEVPTKKIPEITNDKHVPSQEKSVPIQCKCKPTQDKPVPIKCECVPTQDKPVSVQEKTIPLQNKTAPIQCKCVPTQCKCPSHEKTTQDKSQATDKPVQQKPSTFGSPQFPMPSLKKSPHTLYRKLLPAVLFVLTFVTVMTILLIYMDTVANFVSEKTKKLELDAPLGVYFHKLKKIINEKAQKLEKYTAEIEEFARDFNKKAVERVKMTGLVHSIEQHALDLQNISQGYVDSLHAANEDLVKKI